MSNRIINSKTPVFNATVSGVTAVYSSEFYMGGMTSPQACWIINVGAGLTAAFAIMISQDNINYYDSGQVLPSVSGSALVFPAEYDGGFQYVKIQITPSAGSGSVVITGTAKGAA